MVAEETTCACSLSLTKKLTNVSRTRDTGHSVCELILFLMVKGVDLILGKEREAVVKVDLVGVPTTRLLIIQLFRSKNDHLRLYVNTMT
jgi:hypothetical protein